MKEDDLTIEVQNVSKKYGSLMVLDNITFTIKKREVVSIIGKNGAGKTTIVKLVLGLIYPTSGVIRVFNSSPDYDYIKQRISVLFEDNYLYPNLSGLDNLILACNEIKTTAEEMFRTLDKFSLSKRLLSSKASTFSHGQGRRLLLVATILRKPDLFLLDEPFSGIDSEGINALRETMIVEREKGKSFLVTGQNLSYLADIVDRVIYIDTGRVIYDGEVSGIKYILPGNIVIEVNEPSKFASFLLSRGIEFLTKDTNRFFLQATLPKAKEIKEEAVKQGLKFLKFNFTSIEDGGQINEDLNKE
jgi:ABC-2 type transport system ATP-binding protein